MSARTTYIFERATFPQCVRLERLVLVVETLQRGHVQEVVRVLKV